MLYNRTNKKTKSSDSWLNKNSFTNKKLEKMTKKFTPNSKNKSLSTTLWSTDSSSITSNWPKGISFSNTKIKTFGKNASKKMTFLKLPKKTSTKFSKRNLDSRSNGVRHWDVWRKKYSKFSRKKIFMTD